MQVCAGNRRKEQNMVKKTKGFNWGPAATGCSYWTGVRMSTLLNLCGVKSFEQVIGVDNAQTVHYMFSLSEIRRGRGGGGWL